MEIRKAYHEAAHAVFNYSIGCPLESVTLSCMRTTGCRSDRDIMRSLLAGMVGEELCPVDGDFLSAGDIATRPEFLQCAANEYARLYKDPETEDEFAEREKWHQEYCHELANEVRELLSKDPHKTAVATLAAELVDRGEINGPEAERIIRACLGSDLA